MFEKQCEALNAKNAVLKGKGSYSIKEITKMLSICRDSAIALIKRNEFKSVKFGNRVRIVKSSFDAWLDNQIKGGNNNGVHR